MLNIGGGDGLATYSQCIGWPDRAPVRVGRLYVARWPEEIRIVDIALLPEHRGAGIGTSLLEDLVAEAERAGKSLSIHVERFNVQALRFYERLGFETKADKGVYLLMERAPRAG